MVICINNKNYNLTRYKGYDITESDDDTITIINDKQRSCRYSKELFRDISIPSYITWEDFNNRINFAPEGTRLVNTLTGEICEAIGDFNNTGIYVVSESGVHNVPMEKLVFAWKLGMCLKDEKVTPPPKVLISEIEVGCPIIYKGDPYYMGELNGKDKVILHKRRSMGAIRVNKKEVINNEQCFKQ